MILIYVLVNAAVLLIMLVSKGSWLRRAFPLLMSVVGLTFLLVLASYSQVTALQAIPIVALVTYMAVKRFRICPSCQRAQLGGRSWSRPSHCLACGEQL